jgi:hypothetical protein
MRGVGGGRGGDGRFDGLIWDGGFSGVYGAFRGCSERAERVCGFGLCDWV